MQFGEIPSAFPSFATNPASASRRFHNIAILQPRIKRRQRRLTPLAQASITSSGFYYTTSLEIYTTTSSQSPEANAPPSTSKMPTEIFAPLHFTTLLNAHTYFIADFYATWCPPCKQIAPIYNQLSTTHAAPGKFAFVKVNVDEQQQLAAQYGVTAMPTFLVFKNGKKISEVRGADVRGLKIVVEGAASDLKASQAKAKDEVRADEKKAPTSTAEKKADTKVEEKTTDAEEKTTDAEEKTVSGSYGMNSNNNWKMSLH